MNEHTQPASQRHVRYNSANSFYCSCDDSLTGNTALKITPFNVETEALIIGAGPIGLFQAFELGLLGVECCIVEALDRPGGQCTELYADKPIYDIPGTAYTTAADFISQLQKQIEPFKTAIHYQQTIVTLEKGSDRYLATTHTGSTFTAHHVFLATGAGAFTPVKLRTEGIDQFEGSQLHYASAEASQIRNKSVVVIGDGQAAVDSVLSASSTAASVLFLHRKRRLDATQSSVAELSTLVSRNAVQQIKGKITGFSGDSKLEQITVQQSADNTSTHKTDILLVRQGNSPKQSDVESWGVTTAARHIPVDTEHFETSASNVYAVGDINSYPAKRKLILCGFHEATLAAYSATAKLRPDKPLHLQYTTTSTELLQRLGVSSIS